MDIDSNCPYLLPVFGETTSHLTSKLNVMDGRTERREVSILFNVENSIKREIRKNCFSKEKISKSPPPPGIFFYTNFIFFYVGNSMKREENMKY